jgi:hypothetical protein
MVSLVPCTLCARHVRASETACPFCGGTLMAPVPTSPMALSRAALIFAGATTLTACGKEPAPPAPPAPSPTQMPVPAYGPPPDWNNIAPAPASDAGTPPAAAASASPTKDAGTKGAGKK